MSDFTDLILVLVLVACGASYYLIHRIWGRLRRGRLKHCDFLVFEAFPGHLPALEADLSVHGWRLTKSEATQSRAILYRFEKNNERSLPLSEIFDFEKSMPGPATPSADAHLPIKIHAYGSSGDANAKA